MVSAVDRLQAAWDLLGPSSSPFQIQSAVARLLRARDVLVPPGVGR